jgi:hypothetical protein
VSGAVLLGRNLAEPVAGRRPGANLRAVRWSHAVTRLMTIWQPAQEEYSDRHAMITTSMVTSLRRIARVGQTRNHRSCGYRAMRNVGQNSLVNVELSQATPRAPAVRRSSHCGRIARTIPESEAFKSAVSRFRPHLGGPAQAKR